MPLNRAYRIEIPRWNYASYSEALRMVSFASADNSGIGGSGACILGAYGGPDGITGSGSGL